MIYLAAAEPAVCGRPYESLAATQRGSVVASFWRVCGSAAGR
jgi:hypothetical protein